MTLRQETICRQLSEELTKAKNNRSSAYGIGYYEGLKLACRIAQYATEATYDPLLIPLIDLGYITR